jgi:hypothetical protein
MTWQPSRFAGLLAVLTLACAGTATAAETAASAATAATPAAQPSSSGPSASASVLQPYTARYAVSYRGIPGGQIESSLRRGSVPGQWVFETRAYPNLLGRIAISPDARQRSTMETTEAGVRPVSLIFDDGSDRSTKDVSIEFDWINGRAHGESKGKPFDIPVPPGTQDSASVQAAMLYDLLAGRAPQVFWILNGSKLQDYRYWSEGRATVPTPYGDVDTVIWASNHEGSRRTNRVFHAPQFGYVPVLAIQYNKDRPDVRLELVSLKR